MRDTLISAFTVPSEAFKHYIVSIYDLPSDKIFVIPDGIDLNSVPRYDEDSVMKLKLKLNIKDKYVATYIGTPSHPHGFHDLLENPCVRYDDENRSL